MPKYFPSFSVALLGMALAFFVTSSIAYRLSGRASSLGGPGTVVANMPTPPVRSFSIEPALFGALLEDRSASQAPVSAEASAPPGRLLLMGVIADGPYPTAMIRNLVGDTVGLFRIGKGIFGRTEFLLRVDRSSVVVRGPYGKRVLMLGVHPDEQPAIIETNAPPAGMNPGGINVSRSEMNASVKSAEQVLGESKIGPEVVDGKIVGFKVTEVADNSILKKMGILKDDVIKSINGQTLDSLERSARIWEQLKRVSEIHMVVGRKGQDQVLSYYLRP